MNMSMTREAAEAFLTDVHVGVLAIAHEGHGPLAVPIWYQYEDSEVIIGISDDSLKAKLLHSAGRATMTVQSETAPYKYVSVEGPVAVAHDDRDNLSMATRYLGADMGQWYADNNPTTENSVTVRLTPEKWRTIDYSKAL
jgi:hypothetical protein